MGNLRSLYARSPFTALLAAAMVVGAIVGLVSLRTVVGLALNDPGARPWGLLTYPFAIDPLGSSFGIISLIFLVLILLQFGATVESEMGTGRVAAFWAVVTLLFALIASALGIGLAGPWLPSAALIVAWCARNRTARIMLYGILPISGVWLAALTAIGVSLGYGRVGGGFGLAMLVPLGLAWAFASDRLPLPYSAARAERTGRGRTKLTTVRGGQMYGEEYFEDVKTRELEREERERLRKLFEGK